MCVRRTQSVPAELASITCIRVRHVHVVSAYPREIRNREGSAAAPIFTEDTPFLYIEKILLLFFGSVLLLSSSFFRKVLSRFRQSRGPTEQGESRGCSGAHFTFFSAQANKWYPRREQVDSFTDTVFKQTTTETNPQ